MKVLYTTLFIVIADQLTKFLVKGGTIPLLNLRVDGMYYGQSYEVLGEFFKITFVENPGLAFGIDVNDTSKLFLSLFSLLASIGIFYYLYKSRDQKLVIRFALALVLGGAIGNLIDRTLYGVFYGYAPVFYGRVVDFFNVDFFDFTIFGKTFDRWPIFNIADASVTIGVILLLIFHKTLPDVKKEEEKALTPDSEIRLNDGTEINNSAELELTENSEKDGQNNIRKED